MKKLLIPLVALLLLGGGGAFFFLSGDGKTSEDSAHGKAKLDKARIYLEIDPITATIFRDQQPAGTFTAAMTLEISEESARTEIIQSRRRLRDIMFRELHAMFEREEYTGRKVDLDAVKQRMLVVTRREFGDDVVIDVFIKTLMRKGA
jgi:flagellar basal body-associated protein FliL